MRPIKSAKLAMYALGRMKQGDMNKTETEYGNLLQLQLLAGEILWWKFEGMKFRLADNTFYTPDFNVMLPNGQIQIHETKGFWTDDARVKIKVAAELYPFEFIALKKLPKKDGGGWAREVF